MISNTSATRKATNTRASATKPRRHIKMTRATSTMVVTSTPPSMAMPWNRGCSGGSHALAIACSTSWSAMSIEPNETAMVSTWNPTASTAIATSLGRSALSSTATAGLLMLATAAEHRGPSCDAHRRQRPPARVAGLARAAIDEQDLLLATNLPPRVAIRVHRAAAIPDRRLQRFTQGFVQAPRRLAAHASGDAVWTQPRAVQRFVGVDVAHARQRFLIQQHRLERRFSPPQRLIQTVGGEVGIDRFGPKLGDGARLAQPCLGAEQQAPEPAWVAISKLPSVVQREDRVGVVGDGRLRAHQAQLPAHAEMHDQQTLLAQCDEDVLPAALDGLDAVPRYQVGENLRLGVTHDGWKTQLAADDGPPHQVRSQVRHDRLDLGKLGHIRKARGCRACR